MEISDSLKESIISFFEGKLTQSQADELLTWTKQSESNMHYFVQIKEIWHAAGMLNKKEPDIEKGFSDIRKKIAERDIRKLPAKEIRLSLPALLRIAASFLILVALGISGILFFNRNREVTLNTSFVETSVPKGSRSLITLPDGSVVWLNSDTRFRYSVDFGKADRKVFLEGEAYFKVARNEKIVFQVNTSDISVKALGTAFNVKAYKDEENVETTLEEGQVSIDLLNPEKNLNHIKSVLLKPKQTAIYKKQAGDVSVVDDRNQPLKVVKPAAVKKPDEIPLKVINVDDTRLYTSWKDPRWVFKNEKLSSLAPKLERRYDVKITFADKAVEEYAFNGILLEESLEQVLAAIRLTSPIRYEINLKQVNLYEDKQLIKQYRKLFNQ
ncbi:MAG: FecR family protein [Bacteroidales bacterium]